jgi:SagB-type dehydrogenase family enzyme
MGYFNRAHERIPLTSHIASLLATRQGQAYNQVMVKRALFKIRLVDAIFLLAFLASGCTEATSENGKTATGNQIIARAPAEREVRMSITLPAPAHKGITVEEALRKRRSIRKYSGLPVNVQELSELIFAAQGITEEAYGTGLRTAPSAGALYPIEVYIIAHSVKGIEPGLYHYRPPGHTLDLIRKGDMRREVSNAGLGQGPLREAAVVIALTGVFNRTTGKYGERGIKYVFMEAGHVSQNILLEAVSLGLGAVPIGAFRDDELDRLLGLDIGRENSLYLIAVGRSE